jgi:hypothetical protein|tara:strand:+ start:436 stop:573 length:138 start_codon:yes stop_codon:yes gene_type:complete
MQQHELANTKKLHHAIYKLCCEGDSDGDSDVDGDSAGDAGAKMML